MPYSTHRACSYMLPSGENIAIRIDASAVQQDIMVKKRLQECSSQLKNGLKKTRSWRSKTKSTADSNMSPSKSRPIPQRMDSLELIHLRKANEEEKSSSHRNDFNRTSSTTAITDTSSRSMLSFESSLRSSSGLNYLHQSHNGMTLRENDSYTILGSSQSSLRFGDVEIQEYPRALGDNPSCASGGPPIELGWKPVSSRKLDLDEYEKGRDGVRRTREQMLVPPDIREDWLRDAGYGTSEIFKSIQSASRIKRQRERSNSNYIIVHDLVNKTREAFDAMKLRPLKQKTNASRRASMEEEGNPLDTICISNDFLRTQTLDSSALQQKPFTNLAA